MVARSGNEKEKAENTVTVCRAARVWCSVSNRRGARGVTLLAFRPPPPQITRPRVRVQAA